jgi:hypothetical protein
MELYQQRNVHQNIPEQQKNVNSNTEVPATGSVPGKGLFYLASVNSSLIKWYNKDKNRL